MRLGYKTIKEEVEGSFVEKKSRFIGRLCPVQTQAQAEEFIQKISKTHFDATHNVYAYLLREGQIRRYSDNGEPQGTAGIPTLDVLQKSGLTDVCVVVTRYFGGILLGGGGLVRAYSHAVTIAIEQAQIMEMVDCKELQINCDYSFYGKLSYLLPSYNGVVLSSEFTGEVKLAILLRADRYEGFLKELTELSSGQVVPIITGERYDILD